MNNLRRLGLLERTLGLVVMLALVLEIIWRLEWVSGRFGRLWPDGVPQIRNEHGSASKTHFVLPVTGYAHDEAGNRPKLRLGVYLGMAGHKTALM